MSFHSTAIDDKAKECSRRRNIAVQTVSLDRGSSPVRFTLAASAKGVGDGVRRLTFIMARCVTSGALHMKNVHIHAATAGDCAPRQETFSSTDCVDAGLSKPLAECTCDSFALAMGSETSSFGKCVHGSKTRCRAFADSASTAMSGSTRSNAFSGTTSTAKTRTTTAFSSNPDILTSSHTDLLPGTTGIMDTSAPVTTHTITEHQGMPT